MTSVDLQDATAIPFSREPLLPPHYDIRGVVQRDRGGRRQGPDPKGSKSAGCRPRLPDTRPRTHRLTKPQHQTKSPPQRPGIGWPRDRNRTPLTALPCLTQGMGR